MPSTSDVERPAPAVSVVQRYHRRERLLSWVVVAVVVGLFLGTYVAASLAPAVVVGVGLLVLLRAPILRPSGTVRLRTEADVATVVDAFRGPTPPVLAFQWGIADEIATGDDGVTYHVSYLFGSRSTTMTVRTRTETTSADARRVELEITANGRPWATYTATVRREDGQTVVDVEYRSDRRFGLRRLPQQRYAERYRDETLTAQGYEVVERDSQFGF